MADLKSIISRVADIAEDVLPLIAGPAGAAAVEIAKGLIQLGETAKDVLSAEDAAPLANKLPALQASVTAYANETSAGLRGK
jgi:hypothetical protein